MTARRIYIAGGMTGIPDLNRPAFAAAAKRLAAAGHVPVNPHDVAPHPHDGDCPPSYAVSDDGHSAACYLRTCFQALLGCDEVHLLAGWESSVGANREFMLAQWSGIPVTYETGDAPNLTATSKPAIDGLVDAGIVPNDTDEHVTEAMPVIHPGSGKRRLWLTVEVVLPEVNP